MTNGETATVVVAEDGVAALWEREEFYGRDAYHDAWLWAHRALEVYPEARFKVTLNGAPVPATVPVVSYAEGGTFRQMDPEQYRAHTGRR